MQRKLVLIFRYCTYLITYISLGSGPFILRSLRLQGMASTMWLAPVRGSPVIVKSLNLLGRAFLTLQNVSPARHFHALF